MVKLFKPIRRVYTSPAQSIKWVKGLVQRGIAEKPTGKPTWDVWQWTKRKYRIRAVILLLINAVLFAGLGCFTFWLRTGELSPFLPQQYQQFWWAAFNPAGAQQTTLIDFLLYPIPVDQVPMMVVIVGLVLGTLTAIPILVSMLYRFGFSLIFALILAVVAVMPWMAFTVTVCCYLARWKPLQFSFRYATALVSMLPLVVYYALSTRNASVIAHLPWIEMVKLYLPVMLALIAACLSAAIVLTIARVVNYRPGAIAPLLALMFALPVILFEVNVGRDELYYRLIETRFGAGSKIYFVNHVDAEPMIALVAEDRLKHTEESQDTFEEVVKRIRLGLQLPSASEKGDREAMASRIIQAFVTQQHIAKEECEYFLSRYPASRYVPNVLYLKGRAIDMRLEEKFYLQEGRLVLRYYQDFPHAASKEVWQKLYTEYGSSPAAGVAAYRLAFLAVREGNVGSAIDLLNGLIEKYGSLKRVDMSSEYTGSWRAFLAKRTASGRLDIDPQIVVHQGRKLLELLENNRDPKYKDGPLLRLLNFNPHHERYRANLQQLLADIRVQYPESRLADNIELLIVLTEPSRSRRIVYLKAFVDKYRKDLTGDVLPRALYELGVTLQTDNRPAEAKEVYEEVIRDYANSPWELEAQRRLGQLSVLSWPGR